MSVPGDKSTAGKRPAGDDRRFPARDHYRSDAVASAYDAERFRSTVGRQVHERELALVERALAECPEVHTVLDLPAGTGRLADLLSSGGRRALAADRSIQMLRLGMAGYAGGVVADASRLPFADGTFDLLVSLRFTGHVPHEVRRAVLAEMGRVARRRLIVAFYDATPVTGLRRLVRRLRGDVGSGVWYAQSMRKTRRELAELGFTVRAAFPLARFVSETWVLVLDPPGAGAEQPGP